MEEGQVGLSVDGGGREGSLSMVNLTSTNLPQLLQPQT